MAYARNAYVATISDTLDGRDRWVEQGDPWRFGMRETEDSPTFSAPPQTAVHPFAHGPDVQALAQESDHDVERWMEEDVAPTPGLIAPRLQIVRVDMSKRSVGTSVLVISHV